MSQAELVIVHKVVGDSLRAHFNVVAATAWAVYDLLLTIDQEVTRIWKQRVSIPFAIYVIARYYGIFFLLYNAFVQTNDHLSDKFCKGWRPFEAFGVQLLSMIANALLATRVHAFYNRGRTVTFVLVALFAVESIAELVLSTMTGIEAGPMFAHPSGLPVTGCLATVSPRFGIAAWIINITYQSLLFSMAIFRLRGSTRTDVFCSNLRLILVRDCALLFFMMFLANFVNIILNHVVDASPIVEAGVPWLIATLSIGPSRVILNLRGVPRGRSMLSTSDDVQPSRVIAFQAQESDIYALHNLHTSAPVQCCFHQMEEPSVA